MAASRKTVAFLVAFSLLIGMLILPQKWAPFITGVKAADPVPSVAVNKYFNTGASDPVGDIVELLVIQNNLDMQGMIIKDFSKNITDIIANMSIVMKELNLSRNSSIIFQNITKKYQLVMKDYSVKNQNIILVNIFNC